MPLQPILHSTDEVALHRPDGLADSLPRGQRQAPNKKEAPVTWRARGASSSWFETGGHESNRPYSAYARPMGRASRPRVRWLPVA